PVVGTVDQGRARYPAGDLPPAAVDGCGPHLAVLARTVETASQDPFDLGDREPDVERRQCLALRLIATESPQVLRAPVPGAHDAVAVDHHHAEPDRAEDAAQVGVDPVVVLRASA